MISGKTTLIAHIGYPTEAFKAPLLYNPWFDKHGIDAVVVPMGVQAEDYPVVMKEEITPLLKAARDRGCPFLVGTDMLFEMIPAYLEFFGFGTAAPEELRAVARVAY